MSFAVAIFAFSGVELFNLISISSLEWCVGTPATIVVGAPAQPRVRQVSRPTVTLGDWAGSAGLGGERWHLLFKCCVGTLVTIVVGAPAHFISS